MCRLGIGMDSLGIQKGESALTILITKYADGVVADKQDLAATATSSPTASGEQGSVELEADAAVKDFWAVVSGFKLDYIEKTVNAPVGWAIELLNADSTNVTSEEDRYKLEKLLQENQDEFRGYFDEPGDYRDRNQRLMAALEKFAYEHRDEFGDDEFYIVARYDKNKADFVGISDKNGNLTSDNLKQGIEDAVLAYQETYGYTGATLDELFAKDGAAWQMDSDQATMLQNIVDAADKMDEFYSDFGLNFGESWRDVEV